MQRKKVLQHWAQRVSGLGEGFLLMPLVTHATTIPPPLPAFSLSCSIFKDFFAMQKGEREREDPGVLQLRVGCNCLSGACARRMQLGVTAPAFYPRLSSSTPFK
jgi:hypothetical protein